MNLNMYHQAILVAAVLLVSCQAANVNRQLNILNNINHIEHSAISGRHTRKFVAITTKHPVVTSQDEFRTELTCEGIGSPAPSVHWFRDDKPIYEHDLESNKLIDSNLNSLARVVSTLLISRSSSDEEFTCVISAGFKTAKASTIVEGTHIKADHSKPREKLILLKPRILVYYKVIVDTIGSNVVLPCKARGHPRPEITWVDSRGNDARKDPRLKVLRSGELIISSLGWSDMGEFTCVAENSQGRTHATTFVYPAKAG